MTGSARRRHVVVVGGGAAGALFVHHLARCSAEPVDVTVLEPRARLGAGTAYSATHPLHTTNIPASRMSIDPDDPGSFERWLETRGDARGSGDRDAYPQRWFFGDFLGGVLAEARAARPDVRVTHTRVTANRIGRADGRLVVETDHGTLPADAVALATGNPPPLLPEALRGLEADARCVTDPWAPDALAGIPAKARVLIIGTSLTMGDAVVALRAQGHTGEIVAVSRRGMLPQRGLVETVPPFGDFETPPRTAVGLLRRFRAEVRAAEAQGLSWYSVLAAARARAWEVWRALSTGERRRFVRHLRLFYEIHRHVMPGPVADHLSDERARGTLVIRAARLNRIEVADGGFEVDLTPRGAPARTRVREHFDAIVNCTGPAYGGLTRSDPLWSAAAAAGLVRPDAAGLGIETDTKGRAINRDGVPEPDLLVLGTLARFAFGELTGIREISAQARLAAETLLATWSTGDAAGSSPTRDRQPVLERLP